MDDEQKKEIISQFTDSLFEGEEQAERWSSLESAGGEELRPLMQLAQSLRGVLKPVSPVPPFREKLREAIEFQAPAVISIAPPTPRYRKLLMGFAAAGSIVSLAGLSLILFRRRRESGQAATSPA